MKVGSIIVPNVKGQIVIPKEVRDALGINANVPLNLVVRGGGIYLYPVEELVTRVESEDSYFKLLEKTKGAWAGEEWEGIRKARKKIELTACQRRKKKW